MQQAFFKRSGLFALSVISICVFCVLSCKKSDNNGNGGGSTNAKLSYGDSIFYIRAQEYTVQPNITKKGKYRAFPDNLIIDSVTGKITVRIMGYGNESQTGLRYKITFQPEGSNQLDSTFIVLAGLNYLDRIYNLSQNDTIISPVYNADLSKATPAGTYGIQADNQLAINTQNGQINVRECIRRGLFDIPVENGEWEEVTITYKSNDGSNSATNRIDIALYYYRSVQDIPSNVSSLMRAHQTMVLGVSQTNIPITTGPIDTDLPDNISLFKPRPPCVIIVGN